MAEEIDLDLLEGLLLPSSSIKVKNQDVDLYLCKKLYPVLLPALASLAERVETLQKDTERKIDSRVRARFNPIIFLAEHLMRNNPKYSQKPAPQAAQIESFAITQEKKRIFKLRQMQFFKIFENQKFSKNCKTVNLQDIVNEIDQKLGYSSRLSETFKLYMIESQLAVEKIWSFEDFYEMFTDWFIIQKEHSPEDFDSKCERLLGSAKTVSSVF